MQTTMTAQEARERWSELMNRAHYRGEEIVITKNGKPIAKIVGIQKEEVKDPS